MDCALATARLMVPERLRERFDEMIKLRYWFGVSMLVSSHVRIPLLEALWPLLKGHERADVFTSWFDGGDVPSQCDEFLLQVLGEFKRRGRRMFDSKRARERFAELPEVVTIYRADLEKEASSERAVCWTLNREKAIGSAVRYRNSSRRSVLMTARVSRDAICGLFVARPEYEVLIAPHDVCVEQVEALIWSGEAPVLAPTAFTSEPDLSAPACA